MTRPLTPLCELHPVRDRHEALIPARLLLDDGRRIPIDRSCRNAELFEADRVVDWSELEQVTR